MPLPAKTGFFSGDYLNMELLREHKKLQMARVA